MLWNQGLSKCLAFRKIPRCRRPLIKGAIHNLDLFAPLD